MKALSIRQPWAWLIAHGYKPVENRSWPTRYRGPVYLHASKGMTRAEYDDVDDLIWRLTPLNERGDPATVHFPPFDEVQRGGIVGRAEIVDCVTEHPSTFFFGPYAFVIERAQSLPFMSCKGALGFFDVPAEITAAYKDIPW